MHKRTLYCDAVTTKRQLEIKTSTGHNQHSNVFNVLPVDGQLKVWLIAHFYRGGCSHLNSWPNFSKHISLFLPFFWGSSQNSLEKSGRAKRGKTGNYSNFDFAHVVQLIQCPEALSLVNIAIYKYFQKVFCKRAFVVHLSIFQFFKSAEWCGINGLFQHGYVPC